MSQNLKGVVIILILITFMLFIFYWNTVSENKINLDLSRMQNEVESTTTQRPTLQTLAANFINKDLYEQRKTEIIDFKNFTRECKNTSRNEFISSIHKEVDSLEIGAFFRPVLKGKKTKYFDVFNQEKLIEIAKGYGLETSKIPVIDYVQPNGDLTIIKEKFDIIFSSHNLEHQVDLIDHF